MHQWHRADARCSLSIAITGLGHFLTRVPGLLTAAGPLFLTALNATEPVTSAHAALWCRKTDPSHYALQQLQRRALVVLNDFLQNEDRIFTVRQLRQSSKTTEVGPAVRVACAEGGASPAFGCSCPRSATFAGNQTAIRPSQVRAVP